MRACKIDHANLNNTRPGQYYFNWNLRSLSVCFWSCEDSRVPQLNLYSDISIAGELYCSKAIDSNFVQNGGNYNMIMRTHSSLCSWAVYPNKSLRMCSSNIIFRKYKQDSAFRVSGVLQLAKTSSSASKNSPLLRLFLSAAMMARRFYTPCDVYCTNLHILTACGESHIFG